MELLIFGSIKTDSGIRGILDKDNTAVLRNIVNFAETEGVTTHCIREYVASLLANDDNILSALAQAGKAIGDDLYRLALFDIEQIYKKLFTTQIKYTPSGNGADCCEAYKESIKSIVDASSAKELLNRLIAHYRNLGTGTFAKYAAFRYDEDGLYGVSGTEDVTFDSLIGLEYQKQVLNENTTAFLKRLPANNVLLFGDRGTGKSSCVKALLNMYSDEGLRIIEMPKHCIKDIPKLTRVLAEKPHKYILFLDDLTLDPEEPAFKALKIAMEGQLQAKPDNVLIYATSNRRHLIKENHSDRTGDEVHVNDHFQETLSLSERFGISLVFSAPTNQKEYMHIVSELLKQYDVEMNKEIEREANVWQMNYGGRSARCAKQFVAAYLSKEQSKRG